jgi:AT-rich interactive domain-containing protein 2
VIAQQQPQSVVVQQQQPILVQHQQPIVVQQLQLRQQPSNPATATQDVADNQPAAAAQSSVIQRTSSTTTLHQPLMSNGRSTPTPSGSGQPQQQPPPAATTPPTLPDRVPCPSPPPVKVDTTRPFLCEWAGCLKAFRTPKEVERHAIQEHCPVQEGGADIPCLWARCDGMKRKRFSLMTHMRDRHCHPQVIIKQYLQ